MSINTLYPGNALAMIRVYCRDTWKGKKFQNNLKKKHIMGFQKRPIIIWQMGQ